MAKQDTSRDADLVIAEKNFLRIQSDTTKAGYRDGLAAGKDKGMQDGFEFGYNTAATQRLVLGQIRGELCSLKLFASKRNEGNLLTKVESLEQQLETIKQSLVGIERDQLPTEVPQDKKDPDSSNQITVYQLLKDNKSSHPLASDITTLREQLNKLKTGLVSHNNKT